MERLTWRELQQLLQFLREIYACLEPEALVRQVVTALPRLIPSDLTVYDEADVRRGRHLRLVENPAGYTHRMGGPRILEVAGQLLPDHPVVQYLERPGKKRAIRNSDLLPFARFRELAVYREFYRQIGINHQLSVRLSPNGTVLAGIVVNRGGRRDFSPRERLLLDLLGSHLAQAHATAAAVATLGAERQLLQDAVENDRHATILLTADGRVRSASDRARALLTDAFGGNHTKAVPDEVLVWARRQTDNLDAAADAPPRRMPLVIERDGRRVTVRLLNAGTARLLIVEEQRSSDGSRALSELGLTAREAEVLHWVAEGKTNEAIGTILGIRPKTVEKHLESVFRKLGVETRTAAAARVFQALGFSSAPDCGTSVEPACDA